MTLTTNFSSRVHAMGLAALMLSAAPISAANAFQDMAQMPPAQVEVVPAEIRMMAPQMVVSGSVISLNDSRIAAEVEGPLAWIAQVGTSVAEGDVIARIDNRLLAISARQTAANLKRLQADLAYREQDVSRFRELAASDNASTARLQEVVARRDMLAQEIAEAEAAHERAQGDLVRSEIRAPFPGHIVERLANMGEYLTVGDSVLRLVDTKNIEVAIPAPIAITPFLAAGQEVQVEDGLTNRTLSIRAIVPVGDMISRMVEVRLTAPPNSWVIGTPVKVSLPKTHPTESVAVPRDAVIMKGDARYIFKIDSAGKAEQISAQSGTAVGLWVSLNEGVEAGDQIVIRGGERLAPGQTVAIKPAQTSQ